MMWNDRLVASWNSCSPWDRRDGGGKRREGLFFQRIAWCLAPGHCISRSTDDELSE